MIGLGVGVGVGATLGVGVAVATSLGDGICGLGEVLATGWEPQAATKTANPASASHLRMTRRCGRGQCDPSADWPVPLLTSGRGWRGTRGLGEALKARWLLSPTALHADGNLGVAT